MKHWRFAALLGLSSLGACSPIVAPYSADLQHRASDMVAEVDAWDITMVHDAGTPKGDPAGPDVQTTLAKWHGEAAAMAGIAAGLDPGTVDCSKTAGRFRGLVTTMLTQAVAAGQQTQSAAAASNEESGHGCETALVLTVDADLTELGNKLQKFCTAPSPAGRCAAIFGGGGIAANGIAVSDLVHDLQTIVYIETRKAPPDNKS